MCFYIYCRNLLANYQKNTIMKYNLPFLTVLCLIFLSSCNTSDEKIYNESETKLIIEIPVISGESVGEKSTGDHSKAEHPFAGSEFYSPEDMANRETVAVRIHHIASVSSPVLSIPGISDDREILTLSLEWGFPAVENGDYLVQETIDLSAFEYTFSEGIYRINMNNALNQMINRMNEDKDKIFKISISGSATLNLNGFASLEIPVMVTSETFTPRYSLF